MDKKKNKEWLSTLTAVSKEIRLAEKGKAYQLAFIGVCTGIDIIAQEWYCNKSFKLRPENLGLDEKILREKFKNAVAGGNKEKKITQTDYFDCFLSESFIPQQFADLKFSKFRAKMVHDFIPAGYSITHEEPPQRELIGRDEANNKFLIYLPSFIRFFDVFAARLREEASLPENEEKWVYTVDTLEITTPVIEDA